VSKSASLKEGQLGPSHSDTDQPTVKSAAQPSLFAVSTGRIPERLHSPNAPNRRGPVQPKGGTRAGSFLFQNLLALLPRAQGSDQSRESAGERLVSMRARRKRLERTVAGRMSSAQNPTVREGRLAARVAELEAELRARHDFLAIAAHAAPQRLVNAYVRRSTLFLEVARIGSGKLRLQTAEVDLSALIRRVTTNMLPLAERAGCRVRTVVEDEVAARCDPVAVEQIFENLLSNAIRYGPGKPIEIVFASDGKFAELSVRGHGVGIANSDQSLIFERFRQSRRVRPQGGFGIGLWVAHQLVRAMHGDISVSSNPGAGSIFTVTWPLRPAGAEDGD
jgi:two-component system OmpR family sensor kinase